VKFGHPRKLNPSKLENHDYMGDLGLDLNALQLANKAPTVLGGQTVP
jgi:hypothetical protein